MGTLGRPPRRDALHSKYAQTITFTCIHVMHTRKKSTLRSSVENLSLDRGLDSLLRCHDV